MTVHEFDVVSAVAGTYADDPLSRFRPEVIALMNSASMYTLKGGLEQLSKTVTRILRNHCPNVKIKHGTHITEVTPTKPTPESLVRSTKASYSTAHLHFDQIQVSWSTSATKTYSQTFTHALSALPSKALLSALSKPNSKHAVLTTSEAETLGTPTVTVMVVNLYYREANLIRERGFGYLLPRSLTFDQNPEFALGVVFDTDATPALDSSPGTKLTVMLGGHWWDGWTSYPTEADGIRMARSLLRRQLGITAEPALAKATLQKDCIPQYHVGYSKRLGALGDKLSQAFGRRMTIAGASWHGVSVNDCINSGTSAAMHFTKYDKRWDNPVRIGLYRREKFRRVPTGFLMDALTNGRPKVEDLASSFPIVDI